MHFCLLCGYGANAINPYLAFEGIHKLQPTATCPEDEPVEHLTDHYITAVEEGHPEDDVQDGHLHAAELPRRPSSSRPSV